MGILNKKLNIDKNYIQRKRIEKKEALEMKKI